MAQQTFPTGYSNLKTGQLVLTASAQKLNAAYAGASVILIKALKANTVVAYIGTPGVTTATGHALDAGDYIVVPASSVDSIYAIASGAGATLTWLALY